MTVWYPLSIVDIHIIVNQKPQLCLLLPRLSPKISPEEIFSRLIDFQIIQHEFGHIGLVQKIDLLINLLQIRLFTEYLFPQNDSVKIREIDGLGRRQVDVVNVQNFCYANRRLTIFDFLHHIFRAPVILLSLLTVLLNPF